MDVQVLGPIRVTGPAGDAVLGAKERTVLALLVTRVGEVVGYEELIDALWPDDPPRTARRTLQAYVARLRGNLEAVTTGAAAVDTAGHGYVLGLSPEQIDAHRFTRMARLGRRALDEGRPAAAEETLHEALALWRGPPYSGVDAPFAHAEARRLDELRDSAHQDLLACRIRPCCVPPELSRRTAMVAMGHDGPRPPGSAGR
jgi:DNA-binding SARP family transcriptional activator